MYPRSVVTTDDQHRLDLATVYLPRRRNVGYHTALSEADRETLDAIARRMGCTRADALGRAIRLLDLVQERGVRR